MDSQRAPLGVLFFVPFFQSVSQVTGVNIYNKSTTCGQKYFGPVNQGNHHPIMKFTSWISFQLPFSSISLKP